MSPNDTEHARLESIDLPSGGRPVLKLMGRWAAGLLVAAWCVFLLTWGALYGVFLPRVGAWKPEIESQASAVLGVPVRIGQIEVPSSGWIPALLLTEVTLLDEQGRTALRLPRVSASLSPRSLLSLEPRFEQLLVEDAALEVRRDARGRLRVAGFSLDEQSPAAEAEFDATEWLLGQGEFVIRRAQIRWVDEQRGAPPLVLRDVDFVLRNTLRRHDFRLDATPPDEFGGRWTLQGLFRQRLFSARSDWRTWSGELYAELPQAEVERWRTYVDLPAELRAGAGAARVWVDIARGRVQGATADLSLRNVALRWPGVAQPMVFDSLQGRLLAQQDKDSVTVALKQLGFTTGQGLVWPASDMKLVLRHAPANGVGMRERTPAAEPSSSGASQPGADEEGLPALPLFELVSHRQIIGGEFTAAQLDLGLMASIALRAPLGEAVHQRLRELAPEGRIQDMKASWEGPPEAPQRYRVAGRLEDLKLEPAVAPVSAKPQQPGRPGLRGATLVVEASEAGGQASVEIGSGELFLPGVLEPSRLAVEALKLRLSWLTEGKRGQPEFTLSQATFRTADLSGEAQGSWRPGEGAGLGGVLDLSAQIQQMKAEALHRYLPASVSPATRTYLRRAMRGGVLEDISLRVKGDVAELPFDRPGTRGELRISGRWRDGTLAYLHDEAASPTWPQATQLNTRIRMGPAGVEFSDIRARVLGVDINRSSARLDWSTASMPLTLDLQARGPAQDFLRYVQSTTINQWLGRALEAATSTGPGQLNLRLDLPIDGPEPARLRGSYQFANAELRLSPALPAFTAARARVDFTERGFALSGASAQTLGGELSVDGGLAPGAPLRLNVQGTATPAALRSAPEFAWLQPVAARLSGQLPYRVVVGTAAGQLQWTLTSPLSGVGIDLPAPLNKPASVSWAASPLRVTLTGQEGPPGSASRELLEVQLGSTLQARLIRDARSGAVTAGVVGIGASELPALPERGVQALIALDRLELDEWMRVWTSDQDAVTRTGASTTSLLPEDIRLQVRVLKVQGRTLEDVKAEIRPTQPVGGRSGWRADVQASQLAGRLEWRAGSASNTLAASQLVARLSRLSIPPTGADPVEQWMEDSGGDWPSLDVMVDDFELRGRKLGRLEIEASHAESVRDWRLKRFLLRNADAALLASGSWAVPAGSPPKTQRQTSLDFRLELLNGGRLLTRLGFEEALRAGQGELKGRVSWKGSPMAPDIGSLSGQLRVDARDGQFLKVDPGAARLLGVLSLQSLPRRLVLDFRDVFQEGFPFDTIGGDVTVREGVARTNNLRMRGVQAAVLMEGSADITRETQDLRVLVVPEINAGTASLAYATINPALGLGTFLAQLFLRRPLMAANTREFSITGSWTDPKVERIIRATPLSSDEVERAVAEPAGSASAPTAPGQPASSPRSPP